MAQSVGISWLWRLKSDATGSIPAGWVRGVTWVPIFLYSSILTSLRKENHLDCDHYTSLKTSFKKYEQEITSSLEPMKKQADIAMKALSQLDASCAKISDQQTVTKYMKPSDSSEKMSMLGRLSLSTSKIKRLGRS